jgi:peroxiredoxin
MLTLCFAGLHGGVKSVQVGSKAPAFSAKATTGATVSLKSRIEKGPVTLYFIKIGCPVNHRAAPFFKKIDQAYKGKGNIVGVIDGDLEAAKQWQKSYGTSFPIVADPDKKIIGAYGAEHSPWAVGVDKSGKVTKVLEGGSPSELKIVNDLAAKAAGAKIAKLSFDGAPSGGG